MGYDALCVDNDDEAHTTYTYNLEPFIFEPGALPTQQELMLAADAKIRRDNSLKRALAQHKTAVLGILQQCLDSVNDQLERCEDVGLKAQFPLVNPCSFDDLEALAQHDFTIDLHMDVVDRILHDMVRDLLDLVWRHVAIENVVKASAVERHNSAIYARMETLEHHLADRSRQLANCRFAYFLEITHLREQLYIKNSGIDQKFDAVEAYFFDPTEFLEEELREQLNDKIKLSVKVYHEHLVDLRRQNEDLEMKLQTALQQFDFKNTASIDDILRFACAKYGNSNVVNGLADVAEDEMLAWAAEFGQARVSRPSNQCGAGAELEHELRAVQDELEAKKREVMKLRKRLMELDYEDDEPPNAEHLKDIRQRMLIQPGEMDSNTMRDLASPHSASPHRPSARVPDGADVQARSLGLEDDRLSNGQPQDTELANTPDAITGVRLSQDCNSLAQTSPSPLLSSQRAMDEERDQHVKSLHSSLAQQTQQLESERLARRTLELRENELLALVSKLKADHVAAVSDDGDTASVHERSTSALDHIAAPQDHNVSLQDRAASAQEHRASAQERPTSPQEHLADYGLGLQALDELRRTHAEEDREGDESGSGVLARADPLRSHVRWLRCLLCSNASRVAELQRRLDSCAISVQEAVAQADAERAAARTSRSSATEAAAAVWAMRERLDRVNRAECDSGSAGPSTDGQTSPSDNAPETRDGDCESQTNITHSRGGFCMVEVPPTEAEFAIEKEMKDLNACASGNWEVTIEGIQACRWPPLGTGSGFCPRSLFIRLFQGARQRIARQDELIMLCENLKRMELRQVLEGVHYLMESTVPDEDLSIREAIFGKSFTEQNLYNSRGDDFKTLSRRWVRSLRDIIDIILCDSTDIELGVHAGRRIFTPGGGAGGTRLAAGLSFSRAGHRWELGSPTRGADVDRKLWQVDGLGYANSLTSPPVSPSVRVETSPRGKDESGPFVLTRGVSVPSRCEALHVSPQVADSFSGAADGRRGPERPPTDKDGPGMRSGADDNLQGSVAHSAGAWPHAGSGATSQTQRTRPSTAGSVIEKRPDGVSEVRSPFHESGVPERPARPASSGCRRPQQEFLPPALGALASKRRLQGSRGADRSREIEKLRRQNTEGKSSATADLPGRPAGGQHTRSTVRLEPQTSFLRRVASAKTRSKAPGDDESKLSGPAFSASCHSPHGACLFSETVGSGSNSFAIMRTKSLPRVAGR